MALSKLVIGLVAGIGSVAAIGGITAGVVVSRNNTVAETTNETDESNSKENKSSNNSNSLMADESRKNDSTDTVLEVEMKDPGVQISAETESEVGKQPDKPTSGVQNASPDSSSMQSATAQPASTGSTTVSTDAEGQGGGRGMAEAGAQQASAGTDDGAQEASREQPVDAISRTAVAEGSLPNRSDAGDRESQDNQE